MPRDSTNYAICAISYDIESRVERLVGCARINDGEFVAFVYSIIGQLHEERVDH